MTLIPLPRVASPNGTVHQLGRRFKWGKRLCRCGATFERGWSLTSDPLDCGNCLLRIEQASQRSRAEVAS
jgi:hypothetical protein